MQSTQTASLDSCKCLCICLFDCCFIQQILFYNCTGKTNKEPRIESFTIIVLCLVTLVCRPWTTILVRLTVLEVFKSFWDCPGVVSTTCCRCNINWCVCDVILCNSSFKSSVLHPFVFVISSSATHLSNCLTIIHSHS